MVLLSGLIGCPARLTKSTVQNIRISASVSRSPQTDYLPAISPPSQVSPSCAICFTRDNAIRMADKDSLAAWADHDRSRAHQRLKLKSSDYFIRFQPLS
jgi:hypothetical protein